MRAVLAWCVACILLSSWIGIDAIAPPAPDAQAARGGNPTGFDGPYCGLYSVYAAARLNGMKPRPDGIERLLKPQYIGSRAGASAEELEAAAEAMEMHARTFSGLTRLDLMALSSPAILHVKSHPANLTYDHWLLLVSCGATEAVIIDEAPVPIHQATSLLAGRWDGTAVVVSRDPVSAWVRWPTVAFAVVAVVVLIAAARALNRLPVRLVGNGGRRLHLMEIGSLACFALLIGVVCAGMDRNQVIWNSQGRQAVIDRHLDQFLPRASFEEVQALTRGDGNEGVIIVDSRSTDDFEGGHIPTARSVPVYADDAQLRALLDELGQDKRLVIYCQSSQCSFSARLAARLRAMGFKRMAIYHEGWRGWQAGISTKGATR